MGTLVTDASLKLRSQGGRMTNQRKMILESLESLGSHPTAEELFTLASRHDPDLNLSTVYRTLNWLQAEGLISHHHFVMDRHAGRFDPATPVEHHHFICQSCKKVIEFDDPLIAALKSRIAAQNGCLVDSASVTLTGLCPDCR